MPSKPESPAPNSPAKEAPHGDGFADLSGFSVRRWFIFYGFILAAVVVISFFLPAHDRPLVFSFGVLTLFTIFIPGNVTVVIVLLTDRPPVPDWFLNFINRFVDTASWRRDDYLVVALVCAVAAVIANLNEYHGVALLFRAKKVRKFGDTLFYHKAKKWFEQAPFFLLAAANFLPLPVSVVGWLAVSRAYSRRRMALASFLGRFPRYYLTAAFFGFYKPNWWQTLLVCAIIALIPIVIMRIKGRKRSETVLSAEDGKTP